MKIKHFLQLIRYKNLLLLIFMMLLFTSFFHKHIYFSVNLALLTISIICITIFGNIINDILDVEIDLINKPNRIIVGKHISKNKALKLSYLFAFLGTTSGIIISYLIDKLNYSLIFIFTTLLLYFYSKYLKKIALVGNLVVSLLIALSIYLVFLFSESPNDSLRNTFTFQFFNIFAFFAFYINFIREILKDVEDIDGDYNQKLKTLPILIGRKRTQKTIFALTFILLILISFFTVSFSVSLIFRLYTLFLIILPLIYFLYQIINVKSKKELHQLSTLLKIIMFFGLCSILII